MSVKRRLTRSTTSRTKQSARLSAARQKRRTTHHAKLGQPANAKQTGE
jgi:hypothetical protein